MLQKSWIFNIVIIIFASQILFAQEKQFMWEDSLRIYTVYEPSMTPDPNGHPLVIGLHGQALMDLHF